jgi:hypothetical protein
LRSLEVLFFVRSIVDELWDASDVS